MIWPIVRFRRPPGRPPRIVGHRGVGAAAGEDGGPPENTLAAFEEAARQGADAIELDARTAATGELVVLHDPDLERATGGLDTRRVAEVPYEDLRRVDVGGERIPLVVEALSLARARGLAVNIELKHDVPDRLALVRAAARLLGVWDPAHAVLVSSFHPALLIGLRAMAPRVPRALIVHRTWWHDAAVLAAPAVGPTAVHLQRTIAAPDRIEALLRRGCGVSVWTVNDPGEARDLARLGVDALITDAPRKIRDALSG